MGNFVGQLWDRANSAPAETWQWFNSLNREEWLVVLMVTCACGFAAMLGLRTGRM
jgi:hypothetical protein